MNEGELSNILFSSFAMEGSCAYWKINIVCDCSLSFITLITFYSQPGIIYAVYSFIYCRLMSVESLLLVSLVIVPISFLSYSDYSIDALKFERAKNNIKNK